VILDVFSRYVVGWMLAPRESAELAHELIAATCEKEAILPGELTLHADRGTSMRSKPVALLLTDLGVTKSHSQPHVSDDNPYSESQFRTLKYQPQFPPLHAPGMLAVGFSASRSASNTTRLPSRLSPKSMPLNSSAAQLIPAPPL
jgi:transposase InsO family protein